MKGFLILFISTILVTCFAKETKNDQKQKKFFWGFFIDELFYIGAGETHLQLSPIVGYRVSSRLSSGLGFRYMYYHLPGTNAHTYGANVFSDYILIKEIHQKVPLRIAIHSEYECLSLPKLPNQSQRGVMNVLWIGPGLCQPIGANTSLNFWMVWNVLQNEPSPKSPIFRFGLTF